MARIPNSHPALGPCILTAIWLLFHARLVSAKPAPVRRAVARGGTLPQGLRQSPRSQKGAAARQAQIDRQRLVQQEAARRAWLQRQQQAARQSSKAAQVEQRQKTGKPMTAAKNRQRYEIKARGNVRQERNTPAAHRPHTQPNAGRSRQPPPEDIAAGIDDMRFRPLPEFDFKLFNQDMTLLRNAGPPSEDEVLASSPFDKQTAPASLEEVCVPTSVGGDTLVAEPTYQEQAQRGLKAASSKGIVFAGLMRDVGDSVGSLIALLQKAGRGFARYHTIIVENNSKDSTKTNMERECKAKHVSCFNLDIKPYARHKQGQGNPSRVRHFTALRQVLLEKVRRFISISDTGPTSWDFLMLFDGDLLADGSQGFHPSSLYSLLGLYPKVSDSTGKSDEAVTALTPFADAPWDLVCANQLANWPQPGRYRDVFAFRNDSTWKTDWYSMLARDKYFKGPDLVKVKSCFSGMGLYSMRTIQDSGCNYTYEGEDVCEHVAFHKCLARRGHHKVAVYPPFAVRVNDHGVVGMSCAKIGGQAYELVEPDLPVYAPPPTPAPMLSDARQRQAQRRASSNRAKQQAARSSKSKAKPPQARKRR